MPGKRFLHFLGAVAMLLLAWGCGAGTAPNSTNTERSVPVEVTQVELATFRHGVRGVGEIQALETVEVRPELSRTVTEIAFQEGERVEKDEVLFKLDESTLRQELVANRARLELARARLNFTETTYKRYKALTDEGVTTPQRLDEAQNAYEEARAEVARWQAEIELTEERLKDAGPIAEYPTG